MQKVLGLGNALVDILVRIDADDLLKELKLPKGTMQLVEKDKSAAIGERLRGLPSTRESGGSAANTINGLARLGGHAGFIGVVGQDELGDFFEQRMKNNGVTAQLIKKTTGTGTATTLVSSDGERTFATYLGAAVEMNGDSLQPNQLTGYDYLYVEGYLVQDQELIEKAMKLAKGQKIKVAVDLASFNIVQENRDFLLHLIDNYVDLVFANEDEARALTREDPEDALAKLADMTDIAIVKTGSKGSLIQHDDQVFRIGSFKTEVVDTTGAGDLYAAGFLFGLLQDMTIDKCGQIGSFMASKVIEEMGAHIHDDRWPSIEKMLEAVIA